MALDGSKRYPNPYFNRRMIALSIGLPIIGMLTCVALVFALFGFRLLLGPLDGDVLDGGEFVGPLVSTPNQMYSAQVRERHCGATCEADTKVIVTDQRDQTNVRVFRSDRHPCTVIIHWADDKHLVVAYSLRLPNEAEVKKELRQWRDITVSFEEREITASDMRNAYGVSTISACVDRWDQE